MPTLVVLTDGKEVTMPFRAGQSVRDALDAGDLRVRSACDGIGACGLCRIRAVAGDFGEPTLNERFHLADEVEQGIRLACQVRPSSDLTLELLSRAPPSPWRSLPEGFSQAHRSRGPGPLREAATGTLGLAVDIGTTHICCALYDLGSGRWLADRWGRNPQSVMGADIVSRLSAATRTRANGRRLSSLVVEAIGGALQDMAARASLDLRRVARVALVGNSAMLALLAEKGAAALLQPAHWSGPIDCLPEPASTASWIAGWGIARTAQVEVVQPLGGFVGSDVIAGLVGTGVLDSPGPVLFIDFGTNTEIALWNGRELWVTAAAGGPAFEASGVGLAQPAESGAVWRVTCPGPDDSMGYEVVNGTEPKGLCGSGLVDLIAILLRTGRLTETGGLEGEPFVLEVGKTGLTLTKRDVDALQRAKAAVQVGVRAVCEQGGVAPGELARIHVAGAFGRYLDVANAQAIGLLPPVAPDRVALRGNMALAGCADLLLLASAAQEAERLRQAARVVNLAHHPRFDEWFLEGLFLRPFGN